MTEGEKERSSTLRELKAVVIFLQVHVALLKNQSIKWFTDNQNVVIILSKGSMKIDLNNLALYVHKICVENQIVISIDWIPRQENTRADHFSNNARFQCLLSS